MSIAILRGDDAHHDYLSRVLRRRFNIACEFVESCAARERRAAVGRGWWNGLMVRYHAARRRWLGLDQYRRRYFDSLPPEPSNSRETLCVEVDDLNTATVRRALRAAMPSYTVVIGTSILSPETLVAPGCPFINVHGGYLPNYRGNHCFFFARYRRDWMRIGSTIHFVDSGIDTGDIIEHVRTPYEKWESAERLYCRAEHAAIQRLAELLDRASKGAVLTRKPQHYRFPLFQTRDRLPHHDAILYARLGIRWLSSRKGAGLGIERPPME